MKSLGFLRAFSLVLGAAAMTAPVPASAWGLTGHRVVGRIGDSMLTAQTRREIARLLGNESLAEGSTWADFMRAAPDDFWQREASPYHYVTVPEDRAYAPGDAPPEGDAYTALAGFRAEVLDPATPIERKRLALRFIVHIIGDLAQPLHVGKCCDRGGNDVKVRFFGDDTNLHSVWDSGLIDRQQLSYTEMSAWLMRGTDISDAEQWRSADPLDWIADSASIRDGLYPEGTDLGWDYAFVHDATMKRRLVKGGVWLAAYLNTMFDPSYQL